MNKLFVVSAVLALAAGCTKKKPEDKTPPPPTTGSGSAAMATGSGSAAVEQKPAVDTKVVERGAYLVKAGACLVCHTAMGPTGPDLAHPGAGGLEMPDKIGTWRTPRRIRGGAGSVVT